MQTMHTSIQINLQDISTIAQISQVWKNVLQTKWETIVRGTHVHGNESERMNLRQSRKIFIER